MSDRYVVEPHTPLGWHVRDTLFDGPGSVFDAPVKLVVTSEAAAQLHAGKLNREDEELARCVEERDTLAVAFELACPAVDTRDEYLSNARLRLFRQP